MGEINWQGVAFLLAFLVAIGTAIAALRKSGKGEQRIADAIENQDKLIKMQGTQIEAHDKEFTQHISSQAKLHIDQDEFREWRRRTEDKLDKLIEKTGRTGPR
jgi:hypothetical protein